ncbi:MAG: hypothetical protein JO197_06605 [Acidobacteria bacterium]|nr:hypothetical protein [Acidobacteriota bacterium]MBV9477525.1 hypothetical protein [Acidobacteriota bacterium]
MKKQALLVLAFALALPAFAKHRAVTPGDGSRCVFLNAPLAETVTSVFTTDDRYVYFAEDFGSLYRVPKNGGEVEEIADLSDWLVLSMTVDGTHIYIGAIPPTFDDPLPAGAILKIQKPDVIIGALPRPKSDVEVIASDVIAPFSIATDGTYVYWVSVGTISIDNQTIEPDGKIEGVRNDGVGRVTLASNLSAPIELLLDGDDIWFSESGDATGNPAQGLRRVAKAGGPVVHVTDAISAGPIDDAGDSIVTLGATDSGAGLFRIAKADGAITPLVLDDAIEGGPRVEDGTVYFIRSGVDSEDASIMRVPLAGGTPQLIRTSSIGSDLFEVDACALYISEETFLSKVPR